MTYVKQENNEIYNNKGNNQNTNQKVLSFRSPSSGAVSVNHKLLLQVEMSEFQI